MDRITVAILAGIAGLAFFYGKSVLGIVLALPALWTLLSQNGTLVAAVLPGPLRRFVFRDLRAGVASVFMAIDYLIVSKQNISFVTIFERNARKNAKKVAFRYNDTEWTLERVDKYANQVAHYFQSVERLKKGDCVALIATSCPEYVAIWLGLNKIGCVTALINCNLKEDALRHAITAAESRVVIVGADLVENYIPVQSTLEDIQKSLVFCESGTLKYDGILPVFDRKIAAMPETKPEVVDPPRYFDRLFYIYTSGTTGLPKPCIITTHRANAYVCAHHYLIGITKDDVLMCTLPLYHSAGGLIAVGQALLFGTTVVIKKNFSASKFWDDVRKNKCTVFHYVGELCRYLLAQPPKPNDTQHTLRVCYGVGLRPQIWTEFVKRFAIPRIAECYGSTEGNVGFLNIDGRPGAIGFTSRSLEFFKQQFLIRVDMESNEAIRDGNGRCIVCKANEPGELIGKISTGSKFSSFDGYLQKEATTKKQLRDVFQQGDLYFRTGDILMKDEEGYIFFVDRTGDTFRWKGENVSTTEVEGVISRLANDVDVAVFGVSVPGCEGKAGMACISGSDSKVNMDSFSAGVKNSLAAYARPLFLRFVPELEVTGTFKIKKGALREEAYDIGKCGDDRVFFWDPASALYKLLTPADYERLSRGGIRY
ncbi:Long-chain fatty acid transport protein 4 [Hypsibius exemplaris]|uniref:Very long-chain fatty acid transport protein n=1 Tax=Hypsibius exemplaris TaxID=2072580 RepID=A0A9X6RM00_HYPEX|nr:Long-chain fatty acid transport protein 4 [Hypsibius exemplaris]